MDFDCASSRLIGSGDAHYDPVTGVVEMDFVAPPEFASPRGVVQGGLIGGFLDEVMGAAVYHGSNFKLLPLNLDFNISCLKLVPIGPLKAKARVLKMGRKVAFIEGELFSPDGELLARSTSTAMLSEVPAG
ncbi:MAG: PaaI family thioesterase [Sphingomonadaceae bacterium]|nr:PaaI family thioesterase [Sphingomonadaceae bacterium]